jgi:hypothetical protein
MLKRLIMEDWALIVPIISFTVTATVFFTATIRALLMPKLRREELARIPLD